jgi:hypothetical protein
MRMNSRILISLGLFLTILMCTAGADPGSDLPSVLRKGVAEYERGGATLAFYAWQHGGLLEDGPNAATKLRDFKDAAEALGAYKSAEHILTKRIGRSSEIVYVALNFKRGALFLKFWLYQAENDWVVQDLVFSSRPEAIMPWLAVEADSSAEGQ